MRRLSWVVLVCVGCGTGTSAAPDATAPRDAGSVRRDGGARDGGSSRDSGERHDAGTRDAHVRDAGERDGGVFVDVTPPRLVSEPDATFDVRRALVFEFDEPLDGTTVGASSFVVAGSDGTLDRTVTLEDEVRVRITLAETPALPADLTVTIEPQVRDLAGNPFAGNTLRIHAPAWLAHDIDGPGPGDAARAFFAGGAPRLSIRSGGAIHVYTHDEAWKSPLLLTQSATGGPWVAVEGDVALVAWREGSGGSTTIALRRFESDGSVNATPDLVVGTALVVHVALVGGVPIVATFAAGAARIWRFGTTWTEGAAPATFDGSHRRFALTASDGRLWWAEPEGETLRAWQSDGAGGWVPRAAITSDAEDVALAPGPHPALTWTVTRGAQASLHTAVLDTSSPTISTAANLDLGRAASRLAFVVDERGRPLLAWSEASASGVDAYLAAWDQGTWRHRRGVLEGAARHTDRVVLATDRYGRVFVGAWAGAFAGRLANTFTLGDGGRVSSAGAPGCAPLPADGPAFPTSLAATGCFTDHGLSPIAGVIGYSTASRLWSDAAVKRRWLAVPPGASITYNATLDAAWSFPVGTVLIKEFAFERGGDRKVVETRLLTKRCDSGCAEPWEGYSYVWAEDGSGAMLRPAVATTTVASWTVGGETLEHIYPSRAACPTCHTPQAAHVLGLSSLQLDGRRDFDGVVDQQLDVLLASGLVTGGPTQRPVGAPRPEDPHDGSVAARARAYLHANCAHCHRPGGQSTNLAWSAPQVAGGNICSRVVPGEPGASLIWRRMEVRGFSGGVSQMPPLATNVVDPVGVQLVGAWIERMTSCP